MANYGKWTVSRAVGEGGQSRVFIVSEQGDAPQQTVFALKRFINVNRLDRFKTEVDVLQRLSHPSIARIIDFDINGSKPYYVMPYYKYGNARKAGVSSWPLEQKFSFFLDILSAMEAAHKAGVVHRDLKPENVLVSDEHRPIVADFGICWVEGGQRVTLTEEAVGPRTYSAPEIESGRQDSVSARADVYSLGKILYWLLGGRDLPREYHRREEFDLAKMLDEPRFELITDALDCAITEDPDRRDEDAGRFRARMDEIVARFRKTVNYPSPVGMQRCIYCGVGEYQLAGKAAPDGGMDQHAVRVRGGVTPFNESRLRVMICDNCGNTQVFQLAPGGGAKKKWRNPWQARS